MPDFDDVYLKYFKDVYRYILSLCRNETIAEDIAQETFFKALDTINTFDGRCKLYVWLCQIAKNTYFSFCKKEKRFDSEISPSNEQLESGFEKAFLNKEAALEIHKILHALDEPYKEVFSLRFFGELSFSQIATLFGKTESWARVTYHRAKQKIKEELQ